MADSDDEGNSADVVEFGPAYGTQGWDGEAAGPSCGQAVDFCYLCTHFDIPGDGDEDDDDDNWVRKLKDMITTQFEENKERANIVRDVSKMYERYIKEHVTWTHPETGCLIHKPTWTKTAIDRHLLYSLEWSDAQEQTILHTFTAILESQNATMREKQSNEIIESKRQAWVDTVKHYKDFQLYRQRKIKTGRAGKRVQRA